METNEKNESMDSLKKALKEAGRLLDYLFNLEDDYPFLREHLDEAAECVEESLEMKDDDLEEIRERLQDESRRVEELGYYCRALRDFCRDSKVAIPRFITAGFERLCEEDYRQAETDQPHHGTDDDWLLPFRKEPAESLEEALPW